MSILDCFQRLWRSEARHLVFTTIPTDRQEPPVEETVVLAEKHYLRIWLAEMFLRDDRRLFREFVPVVHSAVRLQFADKPAQELPYVAGPQDIGLGNTLGRGIQLNHALTNLLPFRGGTVSLAAGLFAYKQNDFFQGFSQVLHDVTGLLNVGQLSPTLKVVDSVVDGIQNLIAGDKDVHLLYYQGFGGDTTSGGASLRSGYVAIVSADEATFDRNKLFVKQSRLCFGDTIAVAKPLDGYDYMLLRIEASKERDDYLTFETFSKLLHDAIREGHKNRDAGKALIDTAMVAVWSSPDLIAADQVRIAEALKDMYKQAMPPSNETPEPPEPPGTPGTPSTSRTPGKSTRFHSAESRMAVQIEKAFPLTFEPTTVPDISSLNSQLYDRIMSLDIDDAAKQAASLSHRGELPLRPFLTSIRSEWQSPLNKERSSRTDNIGSSGSNIK